MWGRMAPAEGFAEDGQEEQEVDLAVGDLDVDMRVGLGSDACGEELTDVDGSPAVSHEASSLNSGSQTLALLIQLSRRVQ